MLTGKMVRVRYARDCIVPYYLDADHENWRLLAEQMLEAQAQGVPAQVERRPGVAPTGKPVHT
jgi:hypothetical protein